MSNTPASETEATVSVHTDRCQLQGDALGSRSSKSDAMEDEDDECEVVLVVAGQRQEAAANA